MLNFVNSTVTEPWINYQIESVDHGASWSSPQQMVNVTPWEGVLPGPGQGIQLGAHSTRSPSPGRLVMCGATGYHAGHSMDAVVW